MDTQPISFVDMGAQPTPQKIAERPVAPSKQWPESLLQLQFKPLNLTIAPANAPKQTVGDIFDVLLKSNLGSVFYWTYSIPTVTNVQRAASVVAEIDQLLAGAEDETVPTPFAYRNARSIVEASYGWMKPTQIVPTIIPEPLVTTDEAGGIRLAWRSNEKHVRVNFGATPERNSYLYFESNTAHDVEPLDVEHLSRRLSWLTAR